MNIRFVLISPEELRVPDYIIKEVLEPSGIPYIETRSLEESMPELDILYMTRVQTRALFQRGGLHPPAEQLHPDRRKDGPCPGGYGGAASPAARERDYALDVDDDPRAAYFEQVQNGVYVRMALIMTLLGLRDPKTGEVDF